eukprot:Phypoly_transcript_13757.p1 GENE.Phypoly_transcript_13757~~Phypoly_transcript_13757.p1  ORF type:complete len:311 (+),score=51.99 Phypoly_transcript_13757:93-1025(+)
MQLKLIRALWGVLDAAHQTPASWEPLFEKLKGEGYQGLEFCVGPFNPFSSNKALFNELRAKYQFDFIAQIHTCGYPVASHKVEDHLESFKTLVQEAIDWGATFINAHSGSDTWTSAQVIQFYNACVVHEATAGIAVSHETHRRRALFNPFAAREILTAVPALHVTLDVSHWVVVSERVFNEVDDAAFWDDTLALIAQRARLVHARVGYSDGPQVNDPSAPEWEMEVAIHFKWWKRVWAGMAARKLPFAYVEPEHGPAPYLHSLPHTRMPVADLWTVNSWVGRKVAEQFHTFTAATVYTPNPALFPEQAPK